MTVRAKMQLIEVADLMHGQSRVRFTCSYDPTIPEDQRFTVATPTGYIEMQINNPFAMEQLTLGKYYFVDFSEVPLKVDEK